MGGSIFWHIGFSDCKKDSIAMRQRPYDVGTRPVERGELFAWHAEKIEICEECIQKVLIIYQVQISQLQSI